MVWSMNNKHHNPYFTHLPSQSHTLAHAQNKPTSAAGKILRLWKDNFVVVFSLMRKSDTGQSRQQARWNIASWARAQFFFSSRGSLLNQCRFSCIQTETKERKTEKQLNLVY